MFCCAQNSWECYAHLFLYQQELWAPPSGRTQSQIPGNRGAKGFIDKYTDMSYTETCYGTMTRLQTPLPPGDGPVQTSDTKPSCLVTPFSADCAGGRERQRPASGSPSPGAHWLFPPLQGTGTVLRAESGWGQRRETAAASNPEQKTGVSTAAAPDGRSGLQGLQASL